MGREAADVPLHRPVDALVAGVERGGPQVEIAWVGRAHLPQAPRPVGLRHLVLDELIAEPAVGVVPVVAGAGDAELEGERHHVGDAAGLAVLVAGAADDLGKVAEHRVALSPRVEIAADDEVEDRGVIRGRCVLEEPEQRDRVAVEMRVRGRPTVPAGRLREFDWGGVGSWTIVPSSSKCPLFSTIQRASFPARTSAGS